MVPADEAARLVDVAGLSHDLEVLLVVEQESQSPPDHRVVVGEHDPDRAWRLRLSAHLMVVGHRQRTVSSIAGIGRSRRS